LALIVSDGGTEKVIDGGFLDGCVSGQPGELFQVVGSNLWEIFPIVNFERVV
jgi:hypothetical protein